MNIQTGAKGPYVEDVRWAYRLREGETAWKGVQLQLTWEVQDEAFSDDYTPGDATAAELWGLYWRKYGEKIMSDDENGPGVVPIHWFVLGDGGGAGHLEGAPFTGDREDFLTFYTVPVKTDGSGERINWLRLPVQDYAWRPGRCDKGGWFQEATGWKPSPLQPVVDLRLVGLAAGLPILAAANA